MAPGVTRDQAAVLGLLLLSLVGCQATVQSSNSSLPTLLETAAATATSPPSDTSPVASPIGLALQWTEVGSFGEAGTAEYAKGVTRGASSFVAVGTHYEQAFPWDSPGAAPPHEGRVWVSPDGHSWANVTPLGTFANAILERVFAVADGSFIALGRVSPGQCDGCDDSPAGWESADGMNWRLLASGLPSGRMLDLEHGSKGYVALTYEGGLSHIWLSADGRHWEQTYDSAADKRLDAIGAGDQGFVAMGLAVTGDASEPFVLASADGRDWIVSSTPSSWLTHVAPLGGDWFAVVGTLGPDPNAPSPVWFSTNGLEWSETGAITVETLTLGGADGSCIEFPGVLLSASRWLVVSTTFLGPCGEGENVIYGRTLMSADGVSWQEVPFAELPPTGRGKGVFSAVATEGGLLLVGESNGRAAFWLGEAS